MFSPPPRPRSCFSTGVGDYLASLDIDLIFGGHLALRWDHPGTPPRPRREETTTTVVAGMPTSLRCLRPGRRRPRPGMMSVSFATAQLYNLKNLMRDG